MDIAIIWWGIKSNANQIKTITFHFYRFSNSY